MTPEEDAELVRRCPLLYRDRFSDKMSTCMCWGFEIDKGWTNLIYKVSEKIEAILSALDMTEFDECRYCLHSRENHLGNCSGVAMKKVDGSKETYGRCNCANYSDRRPCALQVKEKFGTLRFYMTSHTDEIEAAIEVAEAESAVTCQECGQPGSSRNNNFWYSTFCDKCQDEYVRLGPAWRRKPDEKANS